MTEKTELPRWIGGIEPPRELLAMNGTQIFSSLASGDHTIPMKPKDYVTVTYSVLSPTMTYH